MMCRRLLTLAFAGLCAWGCSERAPPGGLSSGLEPSLKIATLESRPVPEPLETASYVPFTVRTSRQGIVAVGRAQDVVIDVESRGFVGQVTTTLRGVDGVKVIGGGRQAHGDQDRGTRFDRSVQVRLAADVAGYVAIDLTWRERTLMQSATVVFPLASQQGGHRLRSPGTLRVDGSGNKLVVMPSSRRSTSRPGGP